MDLDEAKAYQVKRLGSIVNILYFTRKSTVFKLMPSVIGIEMWCEGVSQKVLKPLNTMGLSLAAEHKKMLITWKAEMKVVK